MKVILHLAWSVEESLNTKFQSICAEMMAKKYLLDLVPVKM